MPAMARAWWTSISQPSGMFRCGWFIASSRAASRSSATASAFMKMRQALDAGRPVLIHVREVCCPGTRTSEQAEAADPMPFW